MASGNNLVVISGCSGSGKSTLIAALAARGETVVTEPGRRIVRQELDAGGDGLPWANVQRFVDLLAAQAVRDYDRNSGSGKRTFFDRSFVDLACGLERAGLIAPSCLALAMASKRFSKTVFMSAPWEGLFSTDEERRHTFADAVAEYEGLVSGYRREGYELVFLPEATVEERVDFVLSVMTSRQG